MNYSEKLKDPRWQQKRLQIFERDGWACQSCGSKEKTLNVHHLEYSSCEPWETDSKLLATLCDDCHGYERQDRKNIEECIIRVLKSNRFFYDDILNIFYLVSTKPDETRRILEPLMWAMRKRIGLVQQLLDEHAKRERPQI